MAMKTRTSSVNNKSHCKQHGAILRYSTYLTSSLLVVLLFIAITTKSVISFTCLPHQATLLLQRQHHSVSRCFYPHSMSMVIPSDPLRLRRSHFRSQLHNHVRWSVPSRKYLRYKTASTSSVSSSVSSSSSSSWSKLHSTSSSSSSMESKVTTVAVDKTNQIEAIQMIFTNYCDADGLMTKMDVKKVPYIADLLSSGDLLLEEFDTIFDQAPKFPDPVSSSTSVNGDGDDAVNVNDNDADDASSTTTTTTVDRIDIDSFVQIYRDIDDLFEVVDDDDDNVNDSTPGTVASSSVNNNPNIATTASSLSAATNGDTAAIVEVNGGSISSPVASSTNVDEELLILGNNDGDDEPDPSLEAELETIYATLCDTAGYITQEQLRKWDEVDKLIQDGLLGEDEFQELWTTTNKSNASVDKLDVDGFLSFNIALDDLFAFDDEEMEDEYVAALSEAEEIANDANGEDNDDNLSEETSSEETSSVSSSRRLIDGDGLSPDVLFVALANADGLVGIDELQQWRELQEMITDGDVLESELMDIYKSVTKSGMDLTKLEVEGFVELYTAIDNLFENESDDDDKEVTATNANIAPVVTYQIELLDAIADLQRDNELPCGLDATTLEQREILSIVELLENDTQNLIRSKQGIIDPQELSGEWELIYSSSSAMKFNQGLTGLGGSVPNGRFSTLKQKLVVTKYLTDVEYLEHIETNPIGASFDVKVTGTWDLRTSVSLFTGEPSIVMNVVPDRVTYGPTSTRADHWKSLGPMNMLDISYLDDNLRVMRGNTSIDTIFVFRRISPLSSNR